MTVNELIERLQDVADDGLGDAEVRLAFQPNWPLQFTVGGVAVPEEDRETERDEDETPETPVIYLVEGSPIHESPYAPAWVLAAAQ